MWGFHGQETREMVHQRKAAGTRILRDFVYRAWLESALPTTLEKPGLTDQNNPL